MLTLLSFKIANWFFAKRYIDENQTYKFAYGIELLISSLSCILVIVLAGILFKVPELIPVFFITFITMRIYCGGFHASTCLNCTLCMFFIFIISIFTSLYISSHIILNYCIMLISFIFLALLSPIESKHKKPLSKKKRKQYKYVSIMLLLLFWVISYFLRNTYPVISSYIIVTLFIVSLLSVIEYIKRMCQT